MLSWINFGIGVVYDVIKSWLKIGSRLKAEDACGYKMKMPKHTCFVRW
jgi:hypothetical protein